MASFAFQWIIIGFAIFPAMCATLALALFLRLVWSGRGTAHARFVIAGSFVPALMIVYGLYLSWPWPWFKPDTMYDGVPLGPLLLSASGPAWLFCLLAARAVVGGIRPSASS